jgi:hypothetical protein
MGVGPTNPWVHTEATREGTPTFADDDLNSDLIKNSVIPACQDATGDEVCY